VIQTAFQIHAFQFTGFQEGLAVGSGARRRWVLGQALAARRKPIKESPTPAEVAEIIVQARARINFKPAPYVVTDLRPLLAEMRAKQEAREWEEFKALILALADEYES
jgi:hypothetical protein